MSPSWKELVVDMVPDQKESPACAVGVRFDPQIWKTVDQAAAARGMTVAGYARRAIMAMASYDLGIPWEQITEREITIMPHGSQGGKSKGRGKKPASPRGKGFGPWRITGVTQTDDDAGRVHAVHEGLDAGS